MRDIFEDMRALVGCTYICDLRSCPSIVRANLYQLELAWYSDKQLEDFAQYIFCTSDATVLTGLQSNHKSVWANHSWRKGKPS